MLNYLKKFAVDIFPSVAATVIGAYIVNHYIVTKPSADAPVAAAALVAARQRRLSQPALAVALLALSLLPAQWGAWMLAMGDEGQFAAMRQVLTAAGPDDTVLDGWSGLGALRPRPGGCAPRGRSRAWRRCSSAVVPCSTAGRSPRR